MSRPIDENDDRPEEAIEPKSISPAENLSSSEAAAQTVLEQDLLKQLDPEARKRWLEAKLKEIESRANYAEAREQSERETARRKRLANDEREEQKPYVRRAVRIAFVLGLILIVLSLAVLGSRSYRIVVQGENIGLGLNPIILFIIGVILLFGNRFIPGLLNLVQRK